MSHFAVMVIGNIEEQLAPFQENNMEDCPEKYLKFKVYDHDSKIRWFNSKEDAVKEFGESHIEEEGFWENPNAKWDWYMIGGRYSDRLLHKNGKWCNFLYKKDLDIDKMKEIAKQEASDFFQKVENAFNGKIPEVEKKWEEFLSDESLPSMEDKRKAYHSQESIINFNKIRTEDKNKDLFGFPFDYEDFIKEKNKYVENEVESSLTFFAFLKDGEWNEKGEMGWWGMVSNEKSDKEFNKAFNKCIESLNDDDLITIVDCHI